MPLSPFRRALAVAATCALAVGALTVGATPASALVDTDHDVTVVGYGNQGASYIANLPQTIGDHAVLDVAVGNNVSFVLRDDNTVYRTWPLDSGTREVTGLSDQLGGRAVTDLEASYTGTFALLEDGALISDTANSNIGATQGFEVATADQHFSQISAGRHFAIALTTEGVMRSWGQNPVGGDGTANVAMIAAGRDSATAYTTDGQILSFGDGAGATLENAAEAAIGEHDVIDISAGTGTNFALLDDGSVVSWGYEAAGYTAAVAAALGTHEAVAIEANGTQLYVTVDDGRVLGFEQNLNGNQNLATDVAILANGHRVLQVTGGEAHALLVLEQPEVVFTAGEAPLDGVVLTIADTVTLTADGFLGGAPYSILWDEVAQTVGTVPSSGVLSQGIGIPDTLAKGIHEVSLVVDGEEFDASVTIGAGFTTAVPTIAGTVKVGEELTVARGSWSLGTSFAYSWLRDGKKIAGATGPSYTLTPADVAKSIQVKVTGTKAGFAAVSKTSVKTAKVAKGLMIAGEVAISGELRVGSTLSVYASGWGPVEPGLAFQWYASGTAIAKQTKPSLVLSSTTVDKIISVRVTGSAAGYTSATAWDTTQSFIDRGAIQLDGYYVDGVAAVGKTVTLRRTMQDAQTTGLTLSYQWQRNGQTIGGAVKSTYKLTTADIGAQITGRVFAARAGYYPNLTTSYPAQIYAQAVTPGTVTVTGTAKVGKTLTVTFAGVPEGVSVDYYWVKKKGSSVVDPEVSGSTYTLQSGDKGYTIQVEAYFYKVGFAAVHVPSKATKPVVG